MIILNNIDVQKGPKRSKSFHFCFYFS